MNLHSDIQTAINMRRKGASYRDIAEKILGDRGKKSTIQDWVKKYDHTVPEKQGARILFIDIETAPAIVAAFGRRKIFLGDDNILVEGGFLLCYAYCWGGGVANTKIESSSLTPEEIAAQNDQRLVAEIWELFNQADAVVAHHGNKFDIPMINSRLVKYGMWPLPTVKMIDTKIMAAKRFAFPTNKLSTVAQYLGLQLKTDPGGIKSWIYVLTGSSEAMQAMVNYNENDVEVLRQVYYTLARFGHSGSNFNAAHYYEDNEKHCHVCGECTVEKTGRKVYTDVSVFEEVRCNSCGTVGSLRKTINTKEKRSSIVRPQRITG